MSRIEAALPAAQELLLLEDAELSVMLANGRDGSAKHVFTVLPNREVLPYAWLEPPQILDDSDDCVDGWEINTAVHVWTKPARLEAASCAEIAGRIRELLKVELSIDGYRVVDWQYETTTLTTDPDGSSHAIVRHRYLVEAAPPA